MRRGTWRGLTTFKGVHMLIDYMTETWRDEAACKDDGEGLFFPEGDSDLGRIAAAKAICASCPVQDECLAYAIETNQPEGIWGGHTPRERRRIRRQWLEEVRRAS